MRYVLAAILSIILGLGIAYGDEKSELLLKQRALQAEMAAIETQFRLLPYQFREKAEELNNVQQQLKAMEEKEKPKKGETK